MKTIRYDFDLKQDFERLTAYRQRHNAEAIMGLIFDPLDDAEWYNESLGEGMGEIAEIFKKIVVSYSKEHIEIKDNETGKNAYDFIKQYLLTSLSVSWFTGKADITTDIEKLMRQVQLLKNTCYDMMIQKVEKQHYPGADSHFWKNDPDMRKEMYQYLTKDV